jgi:hypothetical protein
MGAKYANRVMTRAIRRDFIMGDSSFRRKGAQLERIPILGHLERGKLSEEKIFLRL